LIKELDIFNANYHSLILKKSFVLVSLFIAVGLGSFQIIKKNKDVPRLRLACLSPQLVNQSKESGSIDLAFKACLPELKSILESRDISVPDEAIKVIVASLISYKSALYGNSVATEFKTLLNEKLLDCDNYALLTGYFVPQIQLRFVGFHGGAVGNHAQIIYPNPSSPLLIDPTIGLIAATSYDDLMMGREIEPLKILNFNEQKSNSLKTFTPVVVDALLNGKYRPRDLLYYFESIEHFSQPDKYDRYITPGGKRLRNGN